MWIPLPQASGGRWQETGLWGAKASFMPPHALRHRDFRLIWMGNTLSMVGTQMRIVAITWQLYHLTHSALSLGFVGLTRFIPLALLVLPAGLVADRVDRRKVLLVTQTVMMLASVALYALTVMGWVTPMHIYALLSISAAAATFDLPARQAIIPSLVPREALTQALSLNITGFNVAAVAGPSLGGLILAQGGPATVYALDAVSFVAMLAAVIVMQHRHVPEPRSADASVMTEALEGLRFVWGNRLILSSMLLDFVAMFFGAATTLLPIFADAIVHVDARGLGLLYAAPAVGSVAMGLVTSSRTDMGRQGTVLLVSVVVYGLATAAFGLSGNFWLSLVLLAVTGAADTVSALIRNTIRQLNTPDALRGRMTAVNSLFFIGGPQLGEVEAGFAAQMMGVAPSVVFGGLACAVCVCAVAWRVPELRRYDR